MVEWKPCCVGSSTLRNVLLKVVWVWLSIDSCFCRFLAPYFYVLCWHWWNEVVRWLCIFRETVRRRYLYRRVEGPRAYTSLFWAVSLPLHWILGNYLSSSL
jgi:hypothetical protein